LQQKYSSRYDRGNSLNLTDNPEGTFQVFREYWASTGSGTGEKYLLSFIVPPFVSGKEGRILKGFHVREELAGDTEHHTASSRALLARCWLSSDIEALFERLLHLKQMGL